MEVMWAAVTRYPVPPSQERSTKETELPELPVLPFSNKSPGALGVKGVGNLDFHLTRH